MSKTAVNKTLRCLYFGPIAKKGHPARGGFEAANRKNIDALAARGVAVTETPDPVKPAGKFGALVYARMLFTPFKLFGAIGSRNAVAHFTPLYGSVLYATAWGPLMARLLGVKSVVDIRAGSFIDIYNRGGRFYRWLVRRVLNSASVITVEGRRYIAEIGAIAKKGKRIEYFPNLISCAVPVKREAPTDKVRIFYFGRITANKGIDIIMDAFRRLGDGYEFILAGPVAGDVDMSRLEAGGAQYIGMLTREQLLEQMQRMHLFLFPSTHSGEGQSNALIEAMAAGLVPVASDNGFSRDVVADCGIILPKGADGAEYARAVQSIVEGGRLEELSGRAMQHIARCHNLDTEINKLVELYNSLLCR